MRHCCFFISLFVLVVGSKDLEAAKSISRAASSCAQQNAKRKPPKISPPPDDFEPFFNDFIQALRSGDGPKLNALTFSLEQDKNALAVSGNTLDSKRIELLKANLTLASCVLATPSRVKSTTIFVSCLLDPKGHRFIASGSCWDKKPINGLTTPMPWSPMSTPKPYS